MPNLQLKHQHRLGGSLGQPKATQWALECYQLAVLWLPSQILYLQLPLLQAFRKHLANILP